MVLGQLLPPGDYTDWKTFTLVLMNRSLLSKVIPSDYSYNRRVRMSRRGILGYMQGRADTRFCSSVSKKDTDRLNRVQLCFFFLFKKMKIKIRKTDNVLFISYPFVSDSYCFLLFIFCFCYLVVQFRLNRSDLPVLEFPDDFLTDTN